MSTSKFRFGPQPALDKAVAAQRTCEEALVAARQAAEAEQAKLDAMHHRIAETRQQIADERDKLVSEACTAPPASALHARQRYIQALQGKESQQLGEAEQQARQVQLAREKIGLRKEELREAIQAVKALEQAKERARKRFDDEQRKSDERRRDDENILRFNHRPG